MIEATQCEASSNDIIFSQSLSLTFLVGKCRGLPVPITCHAIKHSGYHLY